MIPKSAPLLNQADVSTWCHGYAPGLCAPRCPISVPAPDFLGGIPSVNARVLVFLPACLLQGRGCQKLRGIKTPVCYAAKTQTTTATAHQNPDKNSGTRRDSDTHTTHYRSYTHYSGTSLRRMSELWAQALIQAYHSYTHTLLGVVEERVTGPCCPPVKGQENTALLSDCGPTGAPLRVSLSGFGGKGCSVCVHSVYVKDVRLPLPLTAEVQFVDCVISARFSVGRKIQSRRRQLLLHQFALTCPSVKQRLMNWA